MTQHMKALPASLAWYQVLRDIIANGRPSLPRGIPILEVIPYTSAIDLRYPVVADIERNLSYKFLAAEAAWILSGDNRVETIAPYNKRIANFSDDGVTFFGAYGPMVVSQLHQVVDKLAADLDSRQAVISIWRPNPPETKDVPCTLTSQWLIRDGKLNCIDTMRSSDVWLGWPYDVFNFAMITYWIRKRLKARYNIDVELGTLFLQAGSQHLYESNHEAAIRVLNGKHLATDAHIDAELITTGLDEKQLLQYLWHMADNTNLYAEWMEATIAAQR